MSTPPFWGVPKNGTSSAQILERTPKTSRNTRIGKAHLSSTTVVFSCADSLTSLRTKRWATAHKNILWCCSYLGIRTVGAVLWGTIMTTWSVSDQYHCHCDRRKTMWHCCILSYLGPSRHRVKELQGGGPSSKEGVRGKEEQGVPVGHDGVDVVGGGHLDSTTVKCRLVYFLIVWFDFLFWYGFPQSSATEFLCQDYEFPTLLLLGKGS